LEIIDLPEVLSAIGMPYHVMGAKQRQCLNVKPIQDADESSLVWISPSAQDKQRLVEITPANLIVCDHSIEVEPFADKKTFIIVENPRLAFLRIVNRLFAPKQEKGIHPSVCIHPAAVIGSNCYIGPFTYIGKSIIGNDCNIMGHVHIYDNVKIGNRVIIHAGTVIGSDGFGFQRNEEGILEKFTHIGGVVIEDDVEIQALSTVDRGAIGNTVIGQNTKVDDHVHIGHNASIGSNCLIAACTMVAGISIKDNVWIGPNATIADGIKIEKEAFITLGSVVVKDVAEHQKVTGNFAIPHDIFIHNLKSLLK
jgi:UDP-3-O-[3-hydroxymyristoyl] glucosamine N-acyltransferase